MRTINVQDTTHRKFNLLKGILNLNADKLLNLLINTNDRTKEYLGQINDEFSFNMGAEELINEITNR